MMRRLLLSLLLIAPLAEDAGAATCTFAAGASSWGPIGVVTGAGWTTPCSLPESSEFVVPSGATVTIVDDVVFDGVSANGKIDVQSGGELIADVAQRSGGPARTTLAVNDRLICRLGSRCQLTGMYRQTGSPNPAPQPTLALAGHLFSGDVVPCPGWDDTADAWRPERATPRASTRRACWSWTDPCSLRTPIPSG